MSASWGNAIVLLKVLVDPSQSGVWLQVEGAWLECSEEAGCVFLGLAITT